MTVLHSGYILLLLKSYFVYTSNPSNVLKSTRNVISYDVNKNLICNKEKFNIWDKEKFLDGICYDDTYSVVSIECNEEFYNETLCYDIELKCPPNFYQYDDYCIGKFFRSMTSKSICPIPGNIFPEEILEEFNNQTLYMPLSRDSKFEPLRNNIVIDKRYGCIYKKENYLEYLLNGTYDKNCAIFSNNKMIFVDCHEKYYIFCAYKLKHSLVNCPRNCVKGSFDHTICFCQKNSEENCKAETKLYKAERKKLEDVFDLSGNFCPSYPSLSTDTNCDICEKKPIYKNIEMVLRIESKSKNMFLTVYNSDNLHSVYCFSDGKLASKSIVDTKLKYRTENISIYKVSLESFPSQYWCEGFQLPDLKSVVSNIIVASKKKYSNEFSFRLRTNIFISSVEIHEEYEKLMHDILKALNLKDVFKENVYKIRLMKLYSIENVRESENHIQMDVDALIHITTKKKRHVIGEYYRFKNQLMDVYQNKTIHFRSSGYCLPDDIFLKNRTLSWSYEVIGGKAIPKEVCVQENGMPVTRYCTGNFLEGAVWGNIEGYCSDNYSVSNSTINLYQMSNSENSPEDTLKNASKEMQQNKNITVLDLYYVENILKNYINALGNTSCVKDIAEIIDYLMNIDYVPLKLSQMAFKFTDGVLKILDTCLCMDRYSANNTEGLFKYKTRSFFVQISKPFLNNISGVALYDDTSHKTYSNENIYVFDKIDKFLKENLLVATYVPKELLNTLAFNLTEFEKQEISIITTVYFNHTLFIDDNDTAIGSYVINVLIPGYGVYLEEPIPIYFLPNSSFNEYDCVFWDYISKIEESYENKSSKWSNLGAENIGFVKGTSYFQCNFTHLTHFALLILSERNSVNLIEPQNSNESIYEEYSHFSILTTITITGCSFSLFGILGIFFTAAVLKRWREKTGTKILLNLSVAIALEIIASQVAGLENWQITTSDNGCIAVGIILQYSVLSKCCWMLVSAYLQYLRFVLIFKRKPQNILQKAVFVGWILPLLPTLTVSLLAINSYKASRQNYCYPTDVAFYLGIVLPVLLIVAANVTIFFKIMLNVLTENNLKSYSGSSDNHKRQVYLATLLFFLLGIPWLFGILAEIISLPTLQILFAYLFCLSATLQGFVLFIFYVILDRDTARQWFLYFKGKK